MKAKSKENNKKEVKKSLKYSIVDGVAYSGMTGFGSSYIRPFAIALNASNAQIGFLSSFPQLIRALFQLHAVRVTDKLKNRKKVVVTAAFPSVPIISFFS